VKLSSAWMTLVLVVFLMLARWTPAMAHQPFFEEEDIKANNPWQIEDPTVSTAVYATLDSPADVDYFTFEVEAGQSILLQMTIPQIEGQEQFAPTMALMGSGLPALELPNLIQTLVGQGGVLLPPPSEPATTFFEPFSRTSYWERQEERVTLPRDGRYVVAVWHDSGEAGRYVFVLGEKEELGGDWTFPIKMRSYWTPVGSTAAGAKILPVECLAIPGGVLAVALVVAAAIVLLRRQKTMQL